VSLVAGQELPGYTVREKLLAGGMGEGGSVRVVPFASATGRIGAAADVFSVEPPLAFEGLDVTPDGDRFLVLLVDPEAPWSTVTVVLDWTDASAPSSG
jgi:hypothetical protein